MQLDSTRIAVRERSLPEVFDLALHVTREFAGPWLLCSLLAIVPLALINYALIGWMTNLDYDTDFPGFRFAWNMLLLIFIEAPLASAFVVAYLGPAVFREQKSIRQVVADVFRFRRARPDDTRPIVNLILCQLILRGVLPAWLIYLTLDPLEFNGFQEGFLLPAIACYSAAMRCFRPYLNEIILLERNPLFSRNPNQITIARRSSHLHGPSSSDLFVRWFLSALLGFSLILLAIFTAEAAVGVLTSMWPVSIDVANEDFSWNIGWFRLQVLYPLCLWLVVAYFSVVRFLSYLDLRIRHEGWEVELLMRAEALRMASKVGV
ncbi:MAG: hypothetical protein WD872_11485 [Pirellulaceae bacterium]